MNIQIDNSDKNKINVGKFLPIFIKTNNLNDIIIQEITIVFSYFNWTPPCEKLNYTTWCVIILNGYK